MKRLIPIAVLATLALSPMRVQAQGNISSCPNPRPMSDPLDWSDVTGGCEVIGSVEMIPRDGLIPLDTATTEIIALSDNLLGWWHLDTWIRSTGSKLPKAFKCMGSSPCRVLQLDCGTDPDDRRFRLDLATRAGAENAVNVRFGPERVLEPWWGSGNSRSVTQRSNCTRIVGHNSPTPTPVALSRFDGPIVGTYSDAECGTQVTMFDRSPVKLRATVDLARLELRAFDVTGCDADDAMVGVLWAVQHGATYMDQAHFASWPQVYLPLGYR